MKVVKRNDFGAPGDYAKRYVLIPLLKNSLLEVVPVFFFIFEIVGINGWD